MQEFFQVMKKCGGRLVSLIGIGFTGASKNVHPAGVSRGVGVGFLDRTEADFLGGASCADFGQQNAKAVYIAREMPVLFARDIAGGADERFGFPRIHQQADIGQDRLSLDIYDIGGLDVAMHEAMPLEEFQCIGEPDADDYGFGKGKGATGDEFSA